MTEQIGDLLRILDRQLLKYIELLDVARALQQTLIKNDVTSFEALLKREHILLTEVGGLEEERLTTLQGLAGRFSVTVEELTLSKLIQLVEPKHELTLTEFQTGISQVLIDLKEVNAGNADLLQQAMGFINFSLNVITGLNAHYNYSATGDEKNLNPERPKIFDRKA